MNSIKAEKWRRQLVAMRNRGISLEKCMDIINKNHGIAKATVKQQWYDRKSWLLEVFDLDYEDTNQLINDLIAERKAIKEALWEVIETSGGNARIGAVREINKIDDSLLELLQSLGLIHKEPQKIDLRQELSEEIKNDPDKKEKIKRMYEIEKELQE